MTLKTDISTASRTMNLRLQSPWSVTLPNFARKRPCSAPYHYSSSPPVQKKPALEKGQLTRRRSPASAQDRRGSLGKCCSVVWTPCAWNKVLLSLFTLKPIHTTPLTSPKCSKTALHKRTHSTRSSTKGCQLQPASWETGIMTAIGRRWKVIKAFPECITQEELHIYIYAARLWFGCLMLGPLKSTLSKLIFVFVLCLSTFLVLTCFPAFLAVFSYTCSKWSTWPPPYLT